MKKRCFLLLFFLNTLFVFSQVGIGTTNPDVSSILDLNSTSKGFLLPRLTSLERDGVATPANGLLIFNTDANEMQINSGTTLLPVWSSPGSLAFSNGLTSASGTVKLGGTLTADTVIDNNNNNLTCTTGTGRLIANGNFETKGAVYAKVRKILALPIVWQADDYAMNITVSGNQNIALPDPTLNAGRVVLIRNNSVQAGGSGSYAYITHIPVNNGSVLASRAQMLISDGVSWFIVAGL